MNTVLWQTRFPFLGVLTYFRSDAWMTVVVSIQKRKLRDEACERKTWFSIAFVS